MTRESALFLLRVIESFTAQENIYAESPEAAFLLDLTRRLKKRLKKTQ